MSPIKIVLLRLTIAAESQEVEVGIMEQYSFDFIATYMCALAVSAVSDAKI